MSGLGKKLCKDLAGELAKLRPNPDNQVFAHELWLEMCRKVAEGAVPMKWEEAFMSACTTHGVWNPLYEEN